MLRLRWLALCLLGCNYRVEAGVRGAVDAEEPFEQDATFAVAKLWGVGDEVTWALRYDELWRSVGGSWQSQTLPSNGFWYGLWGFADNDVWLAGTSSNSAFAALLHWDGTDFSETTTELPGGFSSVWGAASDDIWAAGLGESLAPDEQTVFIVHRKDGILSTPLNVNSISMGFAAFGDSMVWGSASTDVWFANGTLIVHWDGQEFIGPAAPVWAKVTALGGAPAGPPWFGADVFGDAEYRVAMLSQQSTALAVQSLGGMERDVSMQITAIHGSSSNNVWAVAAVFGQETASLVLHWDGTTWRHAATHFGYFRSIWVGESGTVWLGGDEGLFKLAL